MGRKNSFPVVHVPAPVEGRIADDTYDTVVPVPAGYYPMAEHDGTHAFLDVPEVDGFFVCVEATSIQEVTP